MMGALSVGRSTIREVMTHFQALGVVETRKGSGTYLLKPVSKATIHMPLSMDTTHLRDVLLQTLEVRRGIECEAGMVAARKRTPEDLAIIEEKLDEMERVHIAKGASGPEDLAFHLAVYDATHNPLFKQLLEQMRGTFERFWTHPFDREDFARRSFPFHRTLFNAIVAQDPEAARLETLKIRRRRGRHQGNVKMTAELGPFDLASLITAHDEGNYAEAVVPPIFQTSLFTFSDYDDMIASYRGERSGPSTPAA